MEVNLLISTFLWPCSGYESIHIWCYTSKIKSSTFRFTWIQNMLHVLKNFAFLKMLRAFSKGAGLSCLCRLIYTLSRESVCAEVFSHIHIEWEVKGFYTTTPSPQHESRWAASQNVLVALGFILSLPKIIIFSFPLWMQFSNADNLWLPQHKVKGQHWTG